MSSAEAIRAGRTLGCFEVAGRVYGVDVALVREVVRWQPATPLPGAPPLIDGVVDLRGAVIPVVDLGRALGGPAIDATSRARIAVTEIGDRIVGLAVEAAIEVVSVTASDWSGAPTLADGTSCSLTEAVVRRPDAEPIVVLSLERLLERVQRSGPRAGEASA
ncbi:MAG: chemotaxis protein CheW [Myxococcales bacterium]|nr:chemotaxis protein CheW [Myxococcales bacterium]